MITLTLDPDEEKIAQLLTRDAWSYFSCPTELPKRAPVCSIPTMPRNGTFALPEDPHIISYYLTFGETYLEELRHMGWNGRRFYDVCQSFTEKLERASGVSRSAPPDLRAVP